MKIYSAKIEVDMMFIRRHLQHLKVESHVAVKEDKHSDSADVKLILKMHNAVESICVMNTKHSKQEDGQ